MICPYSTSDFIAISRFRLTITSLVVTQRHENQNHQSPLRYLDTAGEDRDTQLIVNHESEKSHLGGTALVEFAVALLDLVLLGEAVPTPGVDSIAEVTRELVSSSWDVLHDLKLKESNKGKDLECTGNRDGFGGSPAGSKVGELGARVINVSWKVDTSLVDEESNNTKHANAAMLEFDVTETVEPFLVGSLEKVERIEESNGFGNTNLCVDGSGGASSLLGRSKGSSGGDEGSKDGGLHFDEILLDLTEKWVERRTDWRKRRERRKRWGRY